MRLIATVLNIASIGTGIYLLIEYLRVDNLLMILILLSAPITSLLAFRVQDGQDGQDGQDWLSLFLRRKTLEERKKIERLNSEQM